MLDYNKNEQIRMATEQLDFLNTISHVMQKIKEECQQNKQKFDEQKLECIKLLFDMINNIIKTGGKLF